MALVSVGAPIILPGIMPLASTSIVVIDAANEYAAGIFVAKSSSPVTEIGFRTSAVATAKPLRCGLMAVDTTTGLPDIAGGWLGAGAAGYFDVASPTANTAHTGTLGASVTLTVGTPYAVVVKLVDDADLPVDVDISYCTNFRTPLTTSVQAFNSLYVPTGSTGSSLPMFNISRSGVYVPEELVSPIIVTGNTNVTVDADGAIREAGNRFRLPFGARAIGIEMHGDLDQNAEWHLYSDAGSSLASTTTDSNVRSGTSLSSGMVLFSAPYTLSADTWYRVAAKATATAGSNLVQKVIYSSAAVTAQLSLGTNCHYCFKGSGAWDDTLTEQRATINIVIDQIETGGAGGGLLVVPGMTGGMRG